MAKNLGFRQALSSIVWGLAFVAATLAQFEPPSPPLPPPDQSPQPLINPHVRGDVETQVQEELASLQAAILKVQKDDPERAKQMLEEFVRASQAIQDMANGSSRIVSKKSSYQTHAPRFDMAQDEVQRLADLNQNFHGGELNEEKSTSEHFAVRLEKLRHAMKSGDFLELDDAQATELEVHYVRLQSGASLPAELRTKENRLTHGYAEVQVERTTKPVVLILECQLPIVWNIKSSAETDIVAVVVESLSNQKILGADDRLVLETRSSSNSVSRIADGLAISRGERLVGQVASTKYVADRYSKPIVIGPSDEAWREAYLSEQIDVLIRDCRFRRREVAAAKLHEEGFRYRGTFANRLQPSVSEYSTADFDVFGPSIPSMKPLNRGNRQLLRVPDGDEQLEFVVSARGSLQTQKKVGKTVRRTPVPFNNKLPGISIRFRGVTYDSKRHRLVCATTSMASNVYSLDIASGEWSTLGQLKGHVLGIVYDKQTDSFWAIEMQNQYGSAMSSALPLLVNLGPDGKPIAKTEVSRPLLKATQKRSGIVGSSNRHAFEMVMADRYVVLVGSEQSEQRGTSYDRAEPYHYVIEIASGQMVYDGPIRPHADDEQRFSGELPILGNTGLAKLFRGMSRLQQVVASNPKPTETIPADLAKQVERLEMHLRGQSIPVELQGGVRGEEDRVYLVGSTSGVRKSTVRITDTSAPITLVLAANQIIEWTLDLAEGVELKKIVLDGSVRPTLLSASAEQSIDGISTEEYIGSKTLRLLSSNRYGNRVLMEKYVKERLGISLSAMTMVDRKVSPSLVKLGPERGDIRLQLVASQVDKLLVAAESVANRKLMDALDQESFFALHRGTLPGSRFQKPAPGTTSVFLNEFTIRGPKVGRSTPAYRSSVFAHTHAKKLYCTDLNRLYITDVETGNSETVSLRSVARNLGRLIGLHLDEQSNSLMIDAQNGLWEYDLAQKTCEQKVAKYGQAAVSSVFSEIDRCWYTLEQKTGYNLVRSRIRRFNENYAFIDQVDLSEPFSGGSYSFSSSHPPQLIVLNNHLAIVSYSQKREVRLMNGRNVSQTRFVGNIAVFEPKTGRVVHTGGLEPRVEFQELSEPELARLWTALGESNEQTAEVLIWQLASGGESSLEYVQQFFEKTATDVVVDVDSLVKELDDNRYSVRSAAFRKLQEAGSRLQSQVEPILEGDVSPEVRERLQSLIRQWNSGQPQSPDQLQRVRAIEALYRVGSESTRQFIESLQDEGFDSYIRLQAARSLKGESLPTGGYQNPAIQLQNKLFVPRVK